MKRPDDSVLFGIRKGIAIYFNDVIEKDRIKEIVRMLVDMTGVTFTGKQAQGEPKIQLVRVYIELPHIEAPDVLTV